MTADHEKIEAWVLDYACKFHYHEVIAALNCRYGLRLFELGVPDARLHAATIHRIVYCRELAELDTAVEVVEELYAIIHDVCPLNVYFRLVHALKMKVLMDQLKTDTFSDKTLYLKLNKYFPRCGIVDFQAPQKHLARLQAMVSNFRKFFLSLLSHENQRNAYVQEEFEKDFGRDFMRTLEKHIARFVAVMDEHLPSTVIEKMLDVGTESICREVPSISAPMDILLECLVNKTKLESHDLLDLLTLLHPISTQDRLKPKLHLTFASDESSNESRLSDLSLSINEDTQHNVSNEFTSSKDRHKTSPESSQPMSASGESVSLLTRRRPGVRPPPTVTRRTKCPTPEDPNLSQVYVISSSSDSASTTQSSQGSQQKGHVEGQAKVLESSKDSLSNQPPEALSSLLEPNSGNSFLEDSSIQILSDSGDISENMSGNNVIQSSNMEEIQETDIDQTKTSVITYPSLGKYQKEASVRLCVIKLYRDESLDVRLNGEQMDVYS